MGIKSKSNTSENISKRESNGKGKRTSKSESQSKGKSASQSQSKSSCLTQPKIATRWPPISPQFAPK